MGGVGGAPCLVTRTCSSSTVTHLEALQAAMLPALQPCQSCTGSSPDSSPAVQLLAQSPVPCRAKAAAVFSCEQATS